MECKISILKPCTNLTFVEPSMNYSDNLLDEKIEDYMKWINKCAGYWKNSNEEISIFEQPVFSLKDGKRSRNNKLIVNYLCKQYKMCLGKSISPDGVYTVLPVNIQFSCEGDFAINKLCRVIKYAITKDDMRNILYNNLNLKKLECVEILKQCSKLYKDGMIFVFIKI